MSGMRHFLGWEVACLPEAARYLLGRYGPGIKGDGGKGPGVKGDADKHGPVDLSGVTVGLPGARAGRRLAELLVEMAGEGGSGGGALVLPRIMTFGPLTDLILGVEGGGGGGIASEVQGHVGWCRALAETGDAGLGEIMLEGESGGGELGYGALADQLDRMHRELAGWGLGFGDVAKLGEAMGEFDEGERWLALGAIQEKYYACLGEVGLVDHHEARARKLGSDEGGGLEGPVVLIGAADLNAVQRGALGRIEGEVVSLIHAPEGLADRFDEWGGLVVEPWCEAGIELGEDQYRIAARFNEQGDEVVAAVGRLPEEFVAEQVTVGVADEKLAPVIEQRLGDVGVPVRYATGLSLGRTGPVRLLSALGDWLERKNYADFATLLRHPDVQRLLEKSEANQKSKGEGPRADGPPGDTVSGSDGAEGEVGIGRGAEDWITLMDRYYADHLQGRLTGAWLGKSEVRENLKGVYDAVGEMAGELTGEKRGLNEWAGPMLDAVLNVYGGKELSRNRRRDRVVLEACDQLLVVLNEVSELKGGLAPEVSAGEAIRLVVGQVSSGVVGPEADDEAVEMLGPLEWWLDDAAALIVTGFNEGTYPASVTADAFLPDGLRSRLGILDNRRRYARDAYALAAILASTEYVMLIGSRLSSAGDPLAPSRLLFACDDVTAANRVIRYFEDDSEGGSGEAEAEGDGRVQSDLPIPTLAPLRKPIESLSVTAFRDYLACPYRFYLKRVLRLDAIDDHIEELDGGAFGNLAHDVLHDFALEKSVVGSTEAGRIGRFLSDRLDVRVKERYGKGSLAAVLLQVEQLRRRLRAFAEWQAGWAAEGWEIEHAELTIGRDEPAELMVDGEAFGIYGRIDRVDVHKESGRRMVIDYKTSDAGYGPGKTHRKGERWVDLQLPLYRRLLGAYLGCGVEGMEGLGLAYVVLPKDVGRTGLIDAGWSDFDLDEADDVARWVIGQLRGEVFGGPLVPAPAFYEAYAGICQEGRLDREIAGRVENEEGGEG